MFEDPSTRKSIDENLTTMMDVALNAASALYPSVDSNVLKARIIANHLRGLVNVLLLADERDAELEVDFKQLSLGLLATADWIDPEELTITFNPTM